MEAFCVAHAYGTAIVQRSGEVHWFPPSARHFWPILLEGEVLPQQSSPDAPTEGGGLIQVIYLTIEIPNHILCGCVWCLTWSHFCCLRLLY